MGRRRRWDYFRSLRLRWWKPIAVGVPLFLTFASWWRDEGPEELQPPRSADALVDAFGLVPWYVFGFLALILALVFVFEASFRRVEGLEEDIRGIKESASRFGLRAEWPSSPITYRLDLDEPEARDGTKFTRPIELHVEGGERIRIERLAASVEVAFPNQEGGSTQSRDSIWMVEDEESVWSAHDAAFVGAPIDLKWGKEVGGVRLLVLPESGLVVRPGTPQRLPVLGIRVHNVRSTIGLFAQSGGIGHWRWHLVASTDHGVFEMEVATPLVLTNTPTPENAPPPPIQISSRPANPEASLDQLIEIGDKLIQRIIDTHKSNPEEDEEGWRAVAETLLRATWPSYLTEFNVAREPRREFRGVALRDEQWRAIRRLAAQQEVLTTVKRLARSNLET